VKKEKVLVVFRKILIAKVQRLFSKMDWRFYVKKRKNFFIENKKALAPKEN
jgi:hypothetical protein